VFDLLAITACERDLPMGLDVRKLLALICTVAITSACSSSSQPGLAPAEPIAQQSLEPLPTGPLTAAQITRALSEKSFRFSSARRNGTVTYYGDSTFSYEEVGKGQGTGLWQSSDGKLCEARNPTSFLPKGTPSICQPISSDGQSFTTGQMQLRPV
jgi:hypothetical protein